jgi:hypothetical protein
MAALLDPSVVKFLNPKLSIGRLKTDIRTDFILAPHYSAIYELTGNELWERAKQELTSGHFEPSLPITMEVPKRSGLTRPGAILEPLDRIVYQAIVDLIGSKAESQLDRTSVFSNVLLKKDLHHQMYEPNNICWNRFQGKIRKHCEDGKWSFAIKADVANYFERLNQHNLINALHSAGCESKAVTFLEKLLSAWMEKDSHGILQGMFPSDFLGNFALCSLDSYLLDREIPFARYVDDVYLFFPNQNEARVGLVDLCRTLRDEGLNLNESKSRIVETDTLLGEETELDRMYEEAREEVEKEDLDSDFYGFMSIWEEESESADPEEAKELHALESLYNRVNDVSEHQAESIERFCLPLLSAIGSDVAVERCLKGITERPHISQIYCSYLSKIITYSHETVKELATLIKHGSLLYDWQLMWPIASLIYVATPILPENTVRAVSGILRDNTRSIALRGVCAIFVGKHGNAGQRRNLRALYSEEASAYVRAAILFSTRFLPASERRTCLRAWRGHSVTNEWIATAVEKLT